MPLWQLQKQAAEPKPRLLHRVSAGLVSGLILCIRNISVPDLIEGTHILEGIDLKKNK